MTEREREDGESVAPRFDRLKANAGARKGRRGSRRAMVFLLGDGNLDGYNGT